MDRAKRRIFLQAGATVGAFLLIGATIFGLTSAWYSNVVQMNALQVKTEHFGFQGSIQVGTNEITASPGDSGVLNMTIRNNGEKTVNIRVDAKKEGDEALQKRIYCYAEQDGEKTYLNSRNGWLYTGIGSNETWNLTENQNEEQVSGKPTIQWQWVYDVEGYYVLGTVKAKTEETTDGGTKIVPEVEVTEYLMPVEYDLDTAVFDNDGQLVSFRRPVSGSDTPKTVTREEFLEELFQAWREDLHYVNSGEGATRHIGNYYLLDVDESGQGVWLYLCDRTAIQEEAATDMTLMEATDPADFKLTLTFTAENSADNS